MFRLKLLGSLDISGADGTPGSAPVRRLKPLVLLAYLAAARPRGFHRREKLTALFWPELSTERARAALLHIALCGCAKTSAMTSSRCAARQRSR